MYKLELMDQKKKLTLIAGVVLLILVIGLGGLLFFGGGKLTLPFVPSGEQEREITSPPPAQVSPPGGEAPALTPERLEIISKIENHVVTIQNQSFSPVNLTIKPHDQVEWQNKDNENYQITGEGWGNVPIGPGESFTQSFETAGTYSYSCTLHSELTGTIVVE